MLYTIYESSGPCSSGQEDFWKLHFENIFLTPWPTSATNWNGLKNFDRGTPRHHFCEVWSKSIKRFQRRCSLKKLLTDARTMDDVRRTLKDHKSSLSTSCSGELKSEKHKKLGFFCKYMLLHGVVRVLCRSVCYFLYGPFCYGVLKLDISTLFTTFFIWTSLQFILGAHSPIAFPESGDKATHLQFIRT